LFCDVTEKFDFRETILLCTAKTVRYATERKGGSRFVSKLCGFATHSCRRDLIITREEKISQPNKSPKDATYNVVMPLKKLLQNIIVGH
jgi:transposase-like protein